jgi:hypothetical protein
MSPLGALIGGGLVTAGLVAYVAYQVGNSRRMGGVRPMLRSIPEALDRAKRSRRNVLVIFVQPEEASSDALLAAIQGAGGLEAELRRGFELVRIDSPEEDREVTDHLAAKYGIPRLEVPTVLALDAKSEKLGTLEGKDKIGTGEKALEALRSFVVLVRPGG